MLLTLILAFLSIAYASPVQGGGLSTIDINASSTVGLPQGFTISMSYGSERINDDSYMESVFLAIVRLARGDLDIGIPARDWGFPLHPDFTIAIRPSASSTVKAEYVMFGLAFSSNHMLLGRDGVTVADAALKIDGQVIGHILYRNSQHTAPFLEPAPNSTVNMVDPFPSNARDEVLGFSHHLTNPPSWIGKPRIYAALMNTVAVIADTTFSFDPSTPYKIETGSVISVEIGEPQSGARTTDPYNNKPRTIQSLRAHEVWMNATGNWYASSVNTFYQGTQISAISIALDSGQANPASQTVSSEDSSFAGLPIASTSIAVS